jgi:hypothetical protein
VLLDVLEHLHTDEIRRLFGSAVRLLSHSGRLLARFPNGLSPFAGLYQRGDLTHVQVLTPEALRQLGEPLGLVVLGGYNPRSLPTAFRARLRRCAAYIVRDIIEAVIGYTYFGRREPLDPNIVVVLARCEFAPWVEAPGAPS